MNPASVPEAALTAALLAAGNLLLVVLLVRVNGLRSFSKMNSFDFVMTVAVGSLLANAATASSWTGLVRAQAAIAGLFATQALLAAVRVRSSAFEDLIDNDPVVLARDGRFFDDVMRRFRVSRADVLAKLREANVTSIEQVRAVVLETTGDISVLHGDQLEPVLLDGTRSTTGS